MISENSHAHFTHGILIVAVILSFGFFTMTSGVYADDKRVAEAEADSLSRSFEEATEVVPAFDSTTTLDDYLVIAMKHNPGLRSAFNVWIADLKKSDYFGSLPDPMVSFAYFIENVETRVGPQEQRFGLRQSFPWFGTLGAKKDMAFAMSQASYQQYQKTKFQLQFQVKAAYYDYYYLGQDVQITRDNLELLKFWESVAQAKYKVGLKRYPDVIKAQVELGKLEDHLNTLQAQIAPKAARLRSLLNVSDETDMPIPNTISVLEIPLDEDSVTNLILANNPGIRALNAVKESAIASERLAGKQALPSFSLGVDYIVTGEAINPDMPESGKDPWMIGASMSLPIWFGENSARKKEARAKYRAAEYDLEDTENQLRAIAAQLLYEYADALRKTGLYRDGLVPKAQQSLNTSYSAYQAGEADFLNVLDAQRQLLNFQLTVVREMTRLATKRAQLEMISGTDLNRYLQK
jgi:outer membrane protein TolC